MFDLKNDLKNIQNSIQNSLYVIQKASMIFGYQKISDMKTERKAPTL